MTVEPIVARIIDEATANATQSLEDAKKRADEKHQQQNAQLLAQQQDALEKAQAEAGQQRERMLRMGQLEERKLDLAMKREVIEVAFEKALERMQAMPVEKAQAFMKKILLGAGGDEQILISPEGEAVFTPAFIAEVNHALTAAGKKGALSLSDQRRPMRGGCILTVGGVETNCTYEALLSQARLDLEGGVAQILFPQQG